MNTTEFHTRVAEAVLAQHRHQVALRHSDLQRRFVFALGLGATVVVGSFRAEVPSMLVVLGVAPLAWAWVERRRIDGLAREDRAFASKVIQELLERHSPPKPSTVREVNER